MQQTVDDAAQKTVLADKIEQFLDYQRSYRSHSPLTISTYR